MLTSKIRTVFDHLRQGSLLHEATSQGDGELLGRFIEHRDEAALAMLVRRHGPMVWGVCRRLLSHHDAEDAFQAAFLVLVRKAMSIAPRQMVGNWLYGVAHQTALQARRTFARRHAREVQVMQMPEKAVRPEECGNLLPILDEELSRLPDKYRVLIVLCELEGRTRKEVARQLRIPEGTVAGRLARARATLSKRLTRRGATLSVGTLAAVLAQNMASASVPNSVVSSTIQTATLVAAGQTAATGVISNQVAALTDGVLKTMLMSKLKSGVAMTLALGLLAVGATALTLSAAATPDDQAPAARQGVDAPVKQDVAKAKEPFTAWGKEVGGLQAGLGYQPGQKRPYHHGETVRLVVRVRNVGKQHVQFQYLRHFFIENPPVVTDDQGKRVPLKDGSPKGIYLPLDASLAPGKEIELYELSLELSNNQSIGVPKDSTLYGPGKFRIQYERVLGSSSLSSVAIKYDAALDKLATGKLELDVHAEQGEGAKEATAQHRFTVQLGNGALWPKVPQCAFLDNDRILVQRGTSVLEIRDAKTGKLLKSVGLERHYLVGDFRLSPDCKSVAAETYADTTGTFLIPTPDVTVWDTTTWKVRGAISGHRLLDLAADGRTVLVRDGFGLAAESGKVSIWDVVDNKKIKVSPFEFRRFDAAAFSPDGSLIAVSGLNEIAYWKWRDGDKYDRLKVGRTVGALVFSPDGKLVAEGPAPRMDVELRDVATLKVVQTLADPGQPQISFMVHGMAFAHSGKTLALGNGIGLIETIPVPHRIHLWDVPTGKLIQKIALKGGMPYSLDVSPDGKTLAAVTADNGVSLRVFDLGRGVPGADRAESPASFGQVPKSVDEPMWMVEFRWAYGLRDGELIRRVPPPYPECRAEYFRNRLRALYKQNKLELPPELLKRDYTEFFTRFAWKDRWPVDHLTMQTWPVKPDEGLRLAQLIHMTTGFPHTRTEGDAGLLEEKITGDFIVQVDADPAKLAAALETILRKECGLSVSLAVREVERKVYVLSGKYESKPLPDRKKDFIEIYWFELRDTATGGGGSGSLLEMADNVEGFVGVPVVVGEVEGAPRRVEWHFNSPSPFTDQARARDRDPEWVLKNIAAQTGLTATREERKVKVLTVKKAE